MYLYKRKDRSKVMEKYQFDLFKSIIDQDRSAIVICNLKHEIIYMNPTAIARYKKRGGANLIGRSLLACHNEKSQELIQNVITWFEKSTDHI